MKKERLLANTLTTDETLLWTEETSSAAFLLRAQTIFGLGFIILWLAFVMSFFAADGEKSKGAGAYFFLTVGLWVLCAQIWESLQAIFTLYGVTNKRLLIVRKSLWASKVESYYAMDITCLKKVRRKNGSGNLIFAVIIEKAGKRTQEKEIGFFGIDDVDALECLVAATFKVK